MALYACIDIHGQYSLFQKMLDGISFSDKDTLFIVGDIIDRGPDSIPMLQDIMNRKNVICLMGNHELMMLTEYLYPQKESYWLNGSNGGIVTKEAFEQLPYGEQFRILKFISGMYLQYDVVSGDIRYLLSHSDFLPDKTTVAFPDLDYDIVFDAVWNSPWRFWEHVPASKYKRDGRIHVIGHVPVQYIRENRHPDRAYILEDDHIVNIDLGCAAMGRRDGYSDEKALCCMNLTAYGQGAGTEAFTYYRNN